MEKELLNEPNFVNEIVELIRSGCPKEELRYKLSDYHDHDIANSLELLTSEERLALYRVLGPQWISGIFAFLDYPEEYTNEVDEKELASVVNEMDADDAVDFLAHVDEQTKKRMAPYLDADVKADITLIRSYDEEEVGSLITTNYICINKNLTIKEAKEELITQAKENDNIATLYVVDEQEKFYGAVELKDLLIAKTGEVLENLIQTSYPYILDHEKIADCIERIKEYSEDSLPVLNEEEHIIGIITAQDIVEAVDDEMGDDYAKLAGLTSEEDLNETTRQSMKKRLPWLIILLFLGMVVSSVVGAFEEVVAVLPIVICFQSLILDMAGNVGTQSLAVTIRVLMDEELTAKDKAKLVFKEFRVGFSNGIFLGVLSLIFLGLYIGLFKGFPFPTAFMISACVGISLLVAMIISSLVGTLIPMFFHKIKVDPAVASGPLITTLNDLVAVVTYYGLSWIILIQFMKIV